MRWHYQPLIYKIQGKPVEKIMSCPPEIRSKKQHIFQSYGVHKSVQRYQFTSIKTLMKIPLLSKIIIEAS